MAGAIRSGSENARPDDLKTVDAFDASEWCFHEVCTNIHHHQSAWGVARRMTCRVGCRLLRRVVHHST